MTVYINLLGLSSHFIVNVYMNDSPTLFWVPQEQDLHLLHVCQFLGTSTLPPLPQPTSLVLRADS